METKSPKVQNSPSCGSASVLTSSALPANSDPYRPALFPFEASATPKVVLPVPIINSSFATQQQLTGEPMLLLPASNIPLSNPLLNSKMVEASALQYSQQLLINNASLPVVLKPPSSPFASDQPLQTSSVTQPLIVLPLNASKNLTSATEEASDSKICTEHQKGNCDSAVKKKDENTNSPSAVDDTTSLGTHTNKSNIAKSKLKAVQQKEAFTTKSSSPRKITGSATQINSNRKQSEETEAAKTMSGACTTISNKSNTISNSSELSSTDISKIISSLPSGWRVVGLTDLNQIGTSHISDTSFLDISQSSSFNHSHALEDSTRNIKNDLQTAEIKHSPQDQPSLVSVNLNTSQPVASEKAYENYPVNELTCSVKLDDIPCTHVISIKTECLESHEVHADSSNTDDALDNKERSKILNKDQVDPSSTSCKSEKQMLAGLDSTSVVSLHPAESHPSLPDMEWKVVGVTSIPPITSTTSTPPQISKNSSTVGQTSAAVTITSTQSSHNSFKEDKTSRAETSSPNTVILQIPLRSPAASKLGSKKSTNNCHKKNVGSDDETTNITSSPKTDSNSFQPLKSEDMKWTVVGIAGSPQNELSTLSPNLSHHHNIGAISFPSVTQIVSQTTATPLIVKSPLPFINSGNVLNNQILNFTSPVSSSSPFLVPSSVSSSQSKPASDTNEKKKSLLSPTNRTSATVKETAKTSPSASTSQVTDQSNLNLSSPQSQLEWKVVGVAPLGDSLGVTPLQIPAAQNNPFIPMSQLSSAPLVPSGPFFIPGTGTSVFPNLTSTVSIPSPGTSSLSAYNLPPSPMILSSSVSPMSLSMSSPTIPVISMPGTSSPAPMILSSPPPALTPTSVSNVKTIQDLAQQHHFTQLMLSQLSAYQNPVNILKLNEPNQWNVVGVVANNQVSVIGPNPNSSVDLPGEIPSSVSSGSAYNSRDRKSSKPVVKAQRKSKENLCDEVMKNSISITSKTIRQSLASRFKRTEPDVKPHHSKCKDMINKHRQSSAKMKKNTVSSLLKMKRLQQKANGNGSSEDGDQSVDETHELSENEEELPHKKSRTRSLRSYAGNRKLFTKTYRKIGYESKQRHKSEEKISLRSGTQIPVSHYKPVVEEVMETLPDTLNNTEKLCEDASMSSGNWNSTEESPVTKVEARSSARRRKLKVPRRMVADLDYHPFDSSSDSN